MMTPMTRMGPPALALVLIFSYPLAACSGGGRETNDTAPAPADSGIAVPTSMDTSVRTDTLNQPTGSPPVATPPITPPPEVKQDTPPAGGAPTGGQTGGGQRQVTQAEYEGWRQYSVNCARCHGQDALPNPVAANLLVSLGPGGPVDTEEKFFQIVSEGRPERGMPAFKAIMSPEQIRATYAYVEGRAEKRIPPGRPAAPSS